ncbi:MAG: LacI family DNA-binding transcriptional regulator [Bacteroidota bacterium]
MVIFHGEMAVTLKDIAKKSGLSVSIVSRVLNKKTVKYRISRETEKLVLKTARELNYRPNQLARGLRLKKTHTIGLVAPDLSNPFFAYIIKSAQSTAHSLGYSLVVCDTDEDLQLEIEHVNLLWSKGVDGLMVMPVGQKSQHLDTLLKNGMPLVLVDRPFEELHSSTVVIDNRLGAFEAVQHLIEHGHRRIAIIQGLADTYTSRGRLQGYIDALAKHGLPLDESLIVGKDFRKQNGYIETKFLLRSSNPPTALFTTSDLITLGALEAIFEEGLEIPRDISVVAFDDIESASLFRCPITAVAQPKENIGEMAVKLLTEQIKGQRSFEPKHIVLKPTLIVRDSVAAPSRPKVPDLSVA